MKPRWITFFGLSLSLSAILILALRPLPADQKQTPLRDLAQRQGLNIGTAAQWPAFRDDAEYRALLAREFNSLTPENELKMQWIRPAPDVYDYAAGDALVDFAHENNMAVRGHVLVWHGSVPEWVEGISPPEVAAVLEDHIKQTVSRYRGKIGVWDVVNEALHDDGQLRGTIWWEALGDDYIGQAFRWAHEADPDALLFYNDYNAEGLGLKSDAVYELLRGLLAEGVPIHGVGLQMHVSLHNFPALSAMRRNIERLSALGLIVHITEMDVLLQYSRAARAKRLADQATLFRDVVALCLVAPACDSFTVWGLNDYYSWIELFTGQADEPLLFDENFQPKPAYEAIHSLLATSPNDFFAVQSAEGRRLESEKLAYQLNVPAWAIQRPTAEP